MCQPLRSVPATAFDGGTSDKIQASVHLYTAQPDELSKLLERCEVDLGTMDSILSELEPSTELDRPNSSDSQVRPSTPKSLLDAAASIHQVANDIEELCRTAEFNEVQTMLASLQSKMVRCLRLLPASGR